MVYSTDRSKAAVPVLVLLFVALRFILRGDLFYVLPCVILFLCFSVLLALGLPRLGKGELILVLSYVCSICACLVLPVSLPLDVWEGLRFVNVALPGLPPLTFFFHGVPVLGYSLIRFIRPLFFVYTVAYIVAGCQLRCLLYAL